MKLLTRIGAWSLALVVALPAAMISTVTLAQEADDDEVIEEVVATGTRREGTSPTETLSPVDVLGGENLANQASFDVTDGITKIAPSLNTQRFPIADGTAVIRPVTLRNLAPDQTLVLLNGSRRHRSALVNLQFSPLGTVNTGAHSVDFGMIPSAAVKRVEILRDGASAQYGSDAIAGVINVILNDANEGITVAAQTGEYFEGDGARTMISANAGFPLGDTGFINATVEQSTSDRTSRGNVRFDCPPVIAEVGVENVPLDGLCQRWGDPDIETLKFFVNAGIDINDSTELFATASVGDNEFRSDFFYRPGVLPASAGGGGSGSLVIDSDGTPGPDEAPQSLVDDIIAQGLNPDDYLTADGASPSGYVLLNPISAQFPGGFNPDFGADISDYSVLLGVRGETAGGLSWDVRGRTAESEADYLLGSTINPSQGLLSPTSFKPGALTQEETAFTVDFVKEIDVDSLASPLNIAFGAEWREETYTLKAGDPDSIAVGPTFLQFGFGSESFQGYPLESAGTFDSSNTAVYIDFEADLTDRFSGGAAVRFEDYDDFGSTFDWKLSGRFEVSETFAIRGTVNTGFRAPTAGQINTLNGTTAANSSGVLVPQFTYPVANPVAVALGAESLDPEESTSFTIGAVFQPLDNTSVTIDFYDITIDDRLTLLNVGSGPGSTLGPAEVQILTDAGIPNAAAFLEAKVAYFVNGFESNVSGVDISIVSDFEIGGGTLTADLRTNINDHEVKNVSSGALSEIDIFDLENQVPNDRTTLTFDYDSGNRFAGYVRFNFYGGWGDSGGQIALTAPDPEVVNYSSEMLVDLEARYSFNDNVTLSVGAENVFDNLPDADGHFIAELLGVKRSLVSPFGFNGGLWYARLSADF